MQRIFKSYFSVFFAACLIIAPLYAKQQQDMPKIDPILFVEAVKSGSLTKIQDMLKVNPDLASAETDEAVIPLSAAMAIPQKELRDSVLTLLLESGADVNAKFGDVSDTVLIQAVREKDYALVQLFLSKNADFMARDALGDNAAALAKRKKLKDIFNLFRDKAKTPEFKACEADKKAAFHAASKNDADAIKVLIDKGFDIKSRNDDGEMVFYTAIRANALEVCRLLQSKGALPNVRNMAGLTPLMSVIRNGTMESAQYLISVKADVNAKDRLGMTPLMYAVMLSTDRKPEVFAAMLLNAGADPNALDRYFSTALMHAVRKGNSEVVRLLLQKGANPALANKSGQTADLMTSSEELKKILIETEKETPEVVPAGTK